MSKSSVFRFQDFAGNIITDKKTPFVDATGKIITPVLGTPFVDGRNRTRHVGESFFDFSGELIEPR